MTARRDALPDVRALIDARIAAMLARTVADAQAFAASPAYGCALWEIVEKGKAALARQGEINPDGTDGL